MSSNTKNPKQSARERLAQERERQERARVRRRGFGIAAAVVAVVGAGAALAIGLAGGNSGPRSGSAAAARIAVPAHASGPGGTEIVYGKPSAPNTLDVYEDFRCPFCDKLEKTDGAAITALADKGTYKIVYHIGTFLDNNLTGSGSHAALAAAGAALNEGTREFKAFHDVLYAHQPEETDDAFSHVGTLLALARKVPGLSTPAFVRAVKDGTYAAWARKVSDAFNATGVQGTPTLKINGKELNLFDSKGAVVGPAAFTAQIERAVAAARK